MPERRTPDKGRRQDPYSILGVPRTATLKEVQKAFQAIMLKYHPDKDPSPEAAARAQEASNAYRDIKERFDGKPAPRTPAPDPVPRPTPPPPRSPRPNPEPKRPAPSRPASPPPSERQPTADEQFRDCLRAIDGGPQKFQQFRTAALARGVSVETIAGWLQSPDAQKRFEQQGIKINIEIWGEHGSKKFVEFVDDWRKVGVDLSQLVYRPDAQRYLQHRGVEIFIKIWGEKNSDKFLEFVESWKAAGVDLSYLAKTPEAQQFLEHTAVEIFIKIWGDHGPQKFKDFVQSWKRAGVDLGPLVNSQPAQEYLTARANLKFRYGSKRELDDFVRLWQHAGWQPPQEIWDKLYKD